MTTLSIFSDSNSKGGNKNIEPLPIISKPVQKILDAFPQPTALLDSEEKVISVNSNFLKLFSYPDSDYLIGKRPEEIFNCIFAIDTFYESQMSSQCRKCGEIINVIDSKVLCNRFTDRCNLTFVDENGHFDDFHNMKINKSPFILDEAQYYLFSITDISDDVRRRLMERIFFHDVLNKAGNIMGILDVLNLVGSDDERSDELYESLKNTSQDLINEIKYQRDLSAAENNELIPALYMTSSLGILNKTRNEIINSDVAYNKEIQIASTSVDEEKLTDGVLLRRVLINMVKNALESTVSGGKVILGCEPLKDESFRFWIHNDAVIPMEIQSQLFYKSTSSKSSDRGLGTFSMRLVGEKYLKGKVNFTSSEADGTLFMIDLPRYSAES